MGNGGHKELMAGKSEIRFPEEIIPDETIAVLWGAVWHTVKKHTARLEFVVPDKSGTYGECPTLSNAHNFMKPVNEAMDQLQTLGKDGKPMRDLLKTLGCSHVICLREFSDAKPTWTAGFHEETPEAYIYDIGSGQGQGFEAKSILDTDNAKFSYYEVTRAHKEGMFLMAQAKKKNTFLQKKIDAAEKACKDCTTEA